MTSLRDRPNTALIVVDVQNHVVANAFQRDSVIANINTLVEKARAREVLQRLESEPMVHKKYGDSFEDTTLESELARRGVGRLVVTGAHTDACIRSTLHGAFTRGYDTLLVSCARGPPANGRRDRHRRRQLRRDRRFVLRCESLD